MHGQVSTRSTRRPHSTLLVVDRFECLAMPCGGRSAGIHCARSPEERFEQRRPIVAALRSQVARYPQSDHVGQKPEGTDCGRPDCCDQSRGLRARWPAAAYFVPTHGSRGLYDAGQARRGEQGHQRMEDCHDACDGERPDQAGGAAGCGRGKRYPSKIKKPTPIRGVNHSRKWSGQAENHSSDWSMDRCTTPRNGAGEKSQNGWKASIGGGFLMSADFSLTKTHTPRNGVLYMLPGYGGLLPFLHALSRACGGQHALA